MRNLLISMTITTALLFNFSVLANETNASTKTESSTSPSAAPVAQSQVVATAEPPSSPNLFLSFSQYHYSLDGGRTANTQIYKFGEAKFDMSLLMATYLYSPTWTFVTIVPYIKNEVETIYEPVAGGLNFKGRDITKGLSDVRFMALTPIVTEPAYFTMLDVGFTLPTGSINEKFTTNPIQRASYNMQLGSGTPDLYVGTTTNNSTGRLSSTARLQATVRGGRNANGWALGEAFEAKLNSDYALTSYFSAGAQVQYNARTAVRGKDSEYELMNGYVGTNGIAGNGHQYYHAPQISYNGHIIGKLKTNPAARISASLEVGLPVFQGFQNKDDVELNTNYFAAGTLTGTF